MHHVSVRGGNILRILKYSEIFQNISEYFAGKNFLQHAKTFFEIYFRQIFQNICKYSQIKGYAFGYSEKGDVEYPNSAEML